MQAQSFFESFFKAIDQSEFRFECIKSGFGFPIGGQIVAFWRAFLISCLPFQIGREPLFTLDGQKVPLSYKPFEPSIRQALMVG